MTISQFSSVVPVCSPSHSRFPFRCFSSLRQLAAELDARFEVQKASFSFWHDPRPVQGDRADVSCFDAHPPRRCEPLPETLCVWVSPGCLGPGKGAAGLTRPKDAVAPAFPSTRPVESHVAFARRSSVLGLCRPPRPPPECRRCLAAPGRASAVVQFPAAAANSASDRTRNLRSRPHVRRPPKR